MIVAVYKNNNTADPEMIHVHEWRDGSLHVESITNSYAHEVAGGFRTIDEVESYLKKRDRVFGYIRKW